MRLLGGGEVTAHLISVISASFCLLLLVKIWLLLMPEDTAGLRGLLAIYTFAPALLTNQSYVLRESFQSLAMLMMLYAAVRWRLVGLRASTVACFIGGLALGASLHHALPLGMLVMAFLALAIGQGLQFSELVRHPTKIVIGALFGVALLVISLPALGQNVRFQALTSGTLLSDTDSFGDVAVRAAAGGRATYGRFWNPARPWTIVQSFLAYQLSPLPIQVSSIADLVLIAENLFRVYMVWTWWRFRNRLDAARRQVTKQILIMWLTLEAIWSIGTVNWGTAARHHVMGFSLILLVGWTAHRYVRTSPAGTRESRPSATRYLAR